MKTVIAGAGLVGPLLAINLKRHGHDVTLFERRTDPRKSVARNASLEARRSINLVITSRGINALNELDLWRKVRDITVPVYGRMIHSLRGETFFQPYGRDEHECNYSVSRSHLNHFLVEQAENSGVQVEFDARLEAVDFAQSKCRFGSREIGYDVLFGADGAGSIVRQALEKAGHIDVRTDWLDTDYKELVIPKERGGELRQNALHIWPRGNHMMMALPNIEGDFTVTLYLPRSGHEYAFDQMRSEADVSRLFESQFSDAIHLIPDYKKDFFANPQGQLGTIRASTWVYKDSVCLIGDAAHAIVPFFGQGMNLGFEDCVELMNVLDGEPSISAALKKFNYTQRPNAEAIADMALENFIEMRDRVGQADFQLKKKIEARIEREWPQLYRSRYGMITYTLTPYKLAEEAGRIQNEILDELARTATADGGFDRAKAHDLLENRLKPFCQKNQVSTKRFEPESLS